MLYLEAQGIGLGKRPRLQLNDRTLSNHRNKLDKVLLSPQQVFRKLAHLPR